MDEPSNEEKMRQKAMSSIGSIHRMVMADGGMDTIAAVGELMLEKGVELAVQAGAEATHVDVPSTRYVGELATVKRLLKYRNNDIAALKAVIGSRNEALKVVKKRKQELKARIRELEAEVDCLENALDIAGDSAMGDDL